MVTLNLSYLFMKFNYYFDNIIKYNVNSRYNNQFDDYRFLKINDVLSGFTFGRNKFVF